MAKIEVNEIMHPLSRILSGLSYNINIPARLIEETISYSAPKYCASKKIQKHNDRPENRISKTGHNRIE